MSKRPAIHPFNKDKPIVEDPNYLPRIVIKFREGVVKQYVDGAEEIFTEDSIGAWRELEKSYPGIRLRRLYTSLSPQEIQALVSRAKDANPDYRPPNFLTYFALTVPGGSDPVELMRRISALDQVEHAYIEGKPAPPPLGAASASLVQGYLKPSVLGIDTEVVKGIPGGDGAGTSFIDIEQGWTLNHEALLAANITLIFGVNNIYRGHGAAVLGQIVAGPNSKGIVGIAPQAQGRVASIWPQSPANPNIPDVNSNIPDAILAATGRLGPGDVIVIEAQVTPLRSSLLLPCEIEPAVFNNIELATNSNIIVVEAAGNGDLVTGEGVDLGGIANLNPNILRDSGAIMVAAASSTEPHTRMSFSNYGQRIDCYAWGEAVATTGSGWTDDNATAYTQEFEGTSSATPIIAGAALVMQGIARARQLNILPPQARAILRAVANGTPPDSNVEPIGVMPDLKRISAVVLAL